MPAPTILKLLAAAPVCGGAADADLLARFTAVRDEAAFAELMRRHGPIVYRVCRRLVGPDAADDAFQAVFLVLACRADRLRKPGSVGSWLVGVAGRVARQLRTREARRAGLELSDVPVDAMPDSHLLGKELANVLDDELTRLPDDLRDAIVLCLIEGRTQDEAAVELGGSVRTLRRRLERAKAVLRLRLERRGIVPAVAAGLVSGGLSGARAAPPELVSRAMRGVSEFLAGGGAQTPAAVVAKGVVAGMVTIKHWVAVACVTVLGLGLAWAATAQPGSPPGLTQPDVKPTPPRAGIPAMGSQPLAIDFGFPIAEQPTDNALSTSHSSANFVVFAPTATMARAIAAEAEYQRAALAKQWLGQELPPGPYLFAIRYTPRVEGIGRTTTFKFSIQRGSYVGPPVLLGGRMDLHGPFLQILTDVLPPEMTYVVMAAHFGRALPRWADEGMSIATSSADSQAVYDTRCREVLNAGRGLRLKALFKMTEYPKDTVVAYAQGHSVVRFLIARGKELPKPGPTEHFAFLTFLKIGMDGNTAESWDKAARDVYAFKSVDDLEQSWLAWLAKPESRLDGSETKAPKRPAEKPDLIPPQNIPGVRNTIPPPPDGSPAGRP